MNCDGYQEQLSAMVDNELLDDELDKLFLHMSTCSDCKAALRSHLELRSDLKGDQLLLAPKELDEKLLHLLSAERKGIFRSARGAVWRRHVSVPWPLAAAIGALFLLGGLAGASVWSPFRQHHDPQVRIVYITALPTVEVNGYFP